MSLPSEAPPTLGSVWCVYCDRWWTRDDMRVEFGARCGNPRGDADAASYGAPYNAGICLRCPIGAPLPSAEAAAMEGALDLYDLG